MKTAFIATLCAIAVTLITLTVFTPQNVNAPAEVEETTFERIKRTGKMRCGYWIWPPLFSFAEDGVSYSGIFYEVMTEVGRILDLEIEWTQQVGYGDFATAIHHNKVDGVCAGVWPVAPRSKHLEFTGALFYAPLYAYTRIDDNRYDNDLSFANSPETTFSSIDGLVAIKIREQQFPLAKDFNLAETSGNAEMFENVVTRKADIIIQDAFTSHGYMTSNPGKLKRLETPPLAVFANTVAVNKGEHDLTTMLNWAIAQLHDTGFIERVLTKYEEAEGSILRVSKPYDS